MSDAKPVTLAQRDATIDEVRHLLDGDPLDAVSLYRGHLAMALGALDEARAALAAMREALDMAHAREAAAEEEANLLAESRDEARREAAEWASRFKQAAERVESEPARIAAAVEARDAAWVRACDTNDGVANINRGLGLRDKHKAWTIVLLAQGTGSTATDADIAAAIRAARGAR